jgi:hypothetical protein
MEDQIHLIKVNFVKMYLIFLHFFYFISTVLQLFQFNDMFTFFIKIWCKKNKSETVIRKKGFLAAVVAPSKE